MLRHFVNLATFPKLAIPIGLTTLVMVGLVWIGDTSLRGIGALTHEAVEREMPGIVAAIDARNLLNEAAVAAQNLIFEAAQNGVDPNEASFLKLMSEADGKLAGLGPAAGNEAALVGEARSAIARFAAIERRVFDLSRRMQNAEAFHLAGGDGRTALAAAREAIERIADAKKVQLGVLSRRADDITRRTTKVQAIAALAGVTVALGLLWGISYFQIARPLRRMAALMRRLAGGDLDIAVEATQRGDEIGVLARALTVFRDNEIAAREVAAERARIADELVEAKNAAESSNRAKTDFLANMSHELRTPLNAVIGFSEFLRQEAFGPLGHPQYREYLADIHASGQHLLAIIDDILDMTRIERGKVTLDENDVALDSAMRAAVTMVEPIAKRAGVPVGVRPGPALTIRADERMLRQILVNLLSNAVKFSPPGAEVAVAAGRDAAGGLVIRVIDHGIGIAPDDIDRVMTPFVQVAGAMQRNHSGTGLGLPITKHFAEMHGGTLALELRTGTRHRRHRPAARRADPRNGHGCPTRRRLSRALAFLRYETAA